MATEQDQRPRYYEDQYLGADDLNLAIDYGRTQDARHALGGHTWGIALGFELREKPRANGDIDVFVSPGYAWDGFGRPIILLEPILLSTNLFQDFTFTLGLDDGSPEGRLLAVWVRYDEQAEQDPVRGFESCESGGQQRRIRETSRLEVTAYQAPLQGRQDSIVVNGTSIAAQDGLNVPPSVPPVKIVDESIPFQIVPASEERKRWPIPLGLVRWKPANGGQVGKIVKREADDLKKSEQSRRYIGVVAESIQAADGHVRVKKRTNVNSSVWTDDLLWVEGPLRVDADVRLLGGALHFQDGIDDPEKSAALIKRVETPSATALQALIEKGQSGLTVNRIAIGAINGTIVDEHVVILDNGKIGMGTLTPTGRLTLTGNQEAQGLLTIFSDGADTADIEYDGGNDKLFVFRHIDATGKTAFMGSNVGIGTTGPTARLSVAGTNETSGTAVFTPHSDKGQNASHIHWDPTGDWYVRSAAAEGKVILQDTGGNVGIGTTDPKKGKLVVDGGKLAVSPSNLTTWPGSWGDGVHTWDLYAEGTIGAGRAGRVDAYLNRNGDGYFAGKVGIGTNRPEASLDIVGTLRVGLGSSFTRIQAGTKRVGASETRSLNVTVDFSSSFSSVPKVMVTARGGAHPDTFAVTTTRISEGSFSVNILRVDPTGIRGGWGQHLQLDWFAWE